VAVFERAGLSDATMAVYRLLLQHPDWLPEHIADCLDVSEAEVRSSFETLADLSLVRPSWDRPGAVRPVSPALGLLDLLTQEHALLARRHEELQRAQSQLNALMEDYGRTLHRTGLDAPVQRLDGLDGVRDWLELMVSRVQDEVLAFVSEPPSAEALAAGRANDARLLERGIRLRSIYLSSVVNDRAARTYVRWLADHGAGIRTVPTLPVRMIICDRSTALLPVDGSDINRGAWLITGSSVIKAVTALFEHYWTFADQLVPERDPSSELTAVTRQEVALLRLLASGVKDESAARALGVSVRTVRRMVETLSARLAAGSRCELGAQAVRAGLV